MKNKTEVDYAKENNLKTLDRFISQIYTHYLESESQESGVINE